MLERIVIVALGVALLALSVVSTNQVRSSEAERDFWQNLYQIERRERKVMAHTCVPVDSKFSLCERSK